MFDDLYSRKKKISVGWGSAPWEEFLNLWVADPLTNLSPKPITNLTIYNIGKITVIKSQQK